MRVTGELRQKMIEAFGDADTQRILSCISQDSKTASTIEAELGLSSSTTYRKIGELRESGLIMIDRFLTRADGKREATYTCTFKEMKFTTSTSAGEEGIGGIELEVTLSKRAEEKKWFDWFFSSPARTKKA